jgi:hypothetical protein
LTTDRLIPSRTASVWSKPYQADGATRTPHKPARRMSSCTRSDAFASSTK